MNRFTISIILSLIVFVIGLDSFTGKNADFTITENDLQFNTPDFFPAPFYDFKENKVTPEGFMLGRKLFYDPILSKDSSVSCGSCHQQSSAFARVDQIFAEGIGGLKGKRNVPALQNLIWENSFMLDGRVDHLEAQPLSPITNPIEMNESFEHVLYKLRQNKEYALLFKRAFNGADIDSQLVLKALSQYTSMLISANSKYDKYLRGEVKFTQQEMRGFKLFRMMGCETCHEEPLFTNNSFELDGTSFSSELRDSGRIAITGMPDDYMRFKVPSLRNIELTGPYMHDGRFKTLKEVLNFYNNFTFLKNHTRVRDDDRCMNAPDGELDDIIAFLKTLTDKDFINDRRFADPNFK